MSAEEVLEQIKKWFEVGDEKAKDIVELPWEVKVYDVEGRKVIEAINPRMPIKFYALLIAGKDVVRIAVKTGFETVYLDSDTRLKIYRDALLGNDSLPLMKYVLMPPNDELALAVDLSIYTLGEKEFNNALTALFVGLSLAASKLGMGEVLARDLMKTLAEMINERIKKGYSPEELVKFLVEKVGMEEGEARGLIEKIVGKGRPSPWIM